MRFGILPQVENSRADSSWYVATVDSTDNTVSFVIKDVVGKDCFKLLKQWSLSDYALPPL